MNDTSLRAYLWCRRRKGFRCFPHCGGPEVAKPQCNRRRWLRLPVVYILVGQNRAGVSFRAPELSNQRTAALNFCLPNMGCFHSKEDYPSEPVTEQPGSASVSENDPKLTPNPDSDDAATTRAPTREENGKLDEGPGTPTAVAAAQAKASEDAKPGFSGAGKSPAPDTEEKKPQAGAAESGDEADDASEAGTSSPVAGDSVSPRSAEPEPVISRSDSKTPASPKGASSAEPAPQRAESAVQVAPKQAPGNGEVSPKRAPSNADVSPKRAPSNADASPKRAPSNADVSPKRAPSNADVPPKRAPSIPEESPKRAPSSAEVTPKRAPSGAQVSPKRAPSSAEVSPKRAASNAEVPPKRAPSGAAVTPKRAPSAKMIPKRAPTLPKAAPSGNEEPAAQGKQEEGEVPSPNA